MQTSFSLYDPMPPKVSQHHRTMSLNFRILAFTIALLSWNTTAAIIVRACPPLSLTAALSLTPYVCSAVEQYPCGYPRLAAFQSSDESFGIYRKFEYLHARVLLDLQYELSELEQELRRADARDAADEKKERRLKSWKRDEIDARKEEKRNENVRTRRRIVADIRQRLVEYGP